MSDTGFPGTDAQFDFSRARRRRALSRLANRLRGEPSDVNLILPFEEVVEALGRRGESSLGLQTIDLDSIVGTVDRGREFDRRFRPTSGSVRARWERIAAAQRRGESMPPIDVYRIGELHFVKDGHHRVSVARALGLDAIDAYVTEVQTAWAPARDITLADLPVKSHERLFFERVPLPADARARVKLSDPRRLLAAGRGRRGVGLPRDAGARGVAVRARGGRDLVPRRVPARGGDAPRGGPDREAHGGRGLHAGRGDALAAAPHPRVGRGDHSSGCGASLR